MKRVFRLPGTRRRAGDELDDELRFHLEGRVEDIMAREHLSRDEAEREARRRFGDYDASPMLPGSPRTILVGQTA